MVNDAPFFQSHAVGDLDGDGTNEIVVVSGIPDTSFSLNLNPFHLYVFNQDGSIRPGWPVLIHPNVLGAVGAHPALADLDRDGHLEIIISEVEWPSLGNVEPCRLHVYREDGSPMPGWPIVFHPSPPAIGISLLELSPVISDLDLDGAPEILVTVEIYTPPLESGRGHQVFAFRKDGSSMPGWPVTLRGNSRTLVVVGNVDATPRPEVITSDVNGNITILAANGRVKRRISAPGGSSLYQRTPSLSLVDLDDDPALEIVYNNANLGGLISVYDGDGSLLPGWPQAGGVGERFTGSTALGDLDGDGVPEIVASTFYGDWNTVGVYAFKSDGSALPGFPITVPFSTGAFLVPLLADLDGDSRPEIVYVNQGPTYYEAQLFAYDSHGIQQPQFSMIYPNLLALFSTPTIVDFDSDGQVDVGMNFGWYPPVTGYLYMSALHTPYQSAGCPWPQFAGNNHNNAVFGLH